MYDFLDDEWMPSQDDEETGSPRSYEWYRDELFRTGQQIRDLEGRLYGPILLLSGESLTPTRRAKLESELGKLQQRQQGLAMMWVRDTDRREED